MQVGRHLLVIRQQLPGAGGPGPADGSSGRRRTAMTDPTYGCGEVEREVADACADQQEAKRRTAAAAAAAARDDARARDPGSSRHPRAVGKAIVPAAPHQNDVTEQLRSTVHAQTAAAVDLGAAAAPVTTAAPGAAGAAPPQALRTSGAAVAAAAALKPCGRDSVPAASPVPHWTAAGAAAPATQCTENITRQTRVAEAESAAAAAAAAAGAAGAATGLTAAAAGTAATAATAAAATTAGHVASHTAVRGQSLSPPCPTHSHTAALTAGASSAEAAGVGVARTALADVGLVVWQSGFVLAEYLLRAPPFGGWGDVTCVDLGTGTGVVGIALALEGCRSSILTDLPHITTLTLLNVAANCDSRRAQRPPAVLPHRWGASADDVIAANSGSRPDLITGADIIFDPQFHGDLLLSLQRLSAPHTVTYLAHRLRRAGEQGFVEKACAHGFAVEVVPEAHLHGDFCHGDYQVLRLCLQDMMEE
ncbi:MAG: hypothetical protein WDW36_008456 [Sanguina aurantia]